MFKMVPTILRNFFSGRATRRYPHVARPPFAKTRGNLQNNISTCTFCGICAAKCPSQCIAVDKENALWHCDPFECIYCGICVESCKTKSLRQEASYPSAATTRQLIILRGTVKEGPGEDPAEV